MALFTRIRNLFSRPQLDREIQAELRAHIDMRTEDNIAAGMSPAEARRDALLRFGNPTVQQERTTAADATLLLESFFNDLRYAVRMLWRSKAFTAVAIGSLALGIGANTIIFSLAKGVLLDRLTVPHPEQLKLLTPLLSPDHNPVQEMWGFDYPTAGGLDAFPQFTYPIFQMLQQQNHEHPVVQDIFAFKFLNPRDRLTLTVGGHAEVINGQMVSGNFYQQLGVTPQLGRAIQPADDAVPGSGNVVILSDALWTRLFNRSPDVIGKTIQLNLNPMTVIGVNPSGFTGAGSVQIAPDVFFPLSMQPVLHPMIMKDKNHPSVLDSKDLWWVQIMARTLSGVPLATAQAALNTWLAQDIRATLPITKDEQMPQLQLADGSRGLAQSTRNFATQLYVLAALTGFVLLLACANLANLLLARASTRQREMAVRLALGAGRARVLRQVLTESLLLSSLGGLAGLIIGYLGRNVIPHMYSGSWQTEALRADFDWTIFAFTLAISMLTGILFGMAPAWQATRVPVNNGLKDAAASSTRRRKGIAGRALVILQVTLSMLLVVAAGLFGSTLHHLYSEQLGFSPQNITLFSIRLPESHYPGAQDIVADQHLEERFSRIPGVTAVTASDDIVLSGGGSFHSFSADDHLDHKGGANINVVGTTFFDVYHIPLRAGRVFNTTDTSNAPLVVVINEKLARSFWPDENPIGHTFRQGGDRSGAPRIVTIVGVVADAKYSNLKAPPPATYYIPYTQAEAEDAREMTFEIKSPLTPAELAPQLRAAVADIDPDLPLRDLRTQQQQIDATASQARLFALLTAAFGILALLLASIGIYGLMAYDVARRTNEIGIRMALGAQAAQMLRMVLREASWMALAGIAAGLTCALLLTKYVQSMLYGLTANDPWIMTGAGLLLFTVAFLAAWAPARRAARIQPMEALRHE